MWGHISDSNDTMMFKPHLLLSTLLLRGAKGSTEPPGSTLGQNRSNSKPLLSHGRFVPYSSSGILILLRII